jgi:uncharacterized protein YjiS (DUF1127 family)
MTSDQQLAHLRKMAEQPKPPSLRKALRELSTRNDVQDMTERLRADIGLRRVAVRMQAMAGATEGLIYG